MLRPHHAPLSSILTNSLAGAHAKSPLAAYARHSIILLNVRDVP